jgi:hypothetical protein
LKPWQVEVGQGFLNFFSRVFLIGYHGLMITGCTAAELPPFFKKLSMTKKQREEFLSKPCEDNITWAAQQIAQLSADKRYQIVFGLRKVHEVLYKSWARDLTLNDLMEAIKMLSSKEA